MPRLSVLITAHNAAATIGPCLESIAKQVDVPAGGVEVVLVDDRSTDETSEAARAAGVDALRLIRIEHASDSNLTTRQVALGVGIRAARGEIIVITDADGIAEPDWVARMTAPIIAGEADGVAGPVHFRAEAGWLGVWQTVDAAYYLAVCKLLNALGFAGGVLFGNFAFRRELFEAVGGFEKIGFALTEDLAFARAVHDQGARLRYVGKGGVEVAACESWGSLIERAKRISAGGFSALAVFIGVWMSLLPLLAVAAIGFGGAFAWLLLGRYLIGAAFTAHAVARVGPASTLPAALLYEPLAIAIGLKVLAGLRRNARVEWGGRSYAR